MELNIATALNTYISLKGKPKEIYRSEMEIDRAIELSGFTGEIIGDVRSKMKLGTTIIKELWERCNPRTDEEILEFYTTTDAYLYELSANECSDGKINQLLLMLNLVKKYNPRNILVYGAGICSEAIPIAESFPCTRIHVADVISVHFKYGRYRMKTRGHSFTHHTIMGNTYGAEIPELYDMIICFDTLEHVAEPKILAKNIYDHLYPKGVALLEFMFNKHSGFLPEKQNTHPLHITHTKDGISLKGGHFKAHLKSLGFQSDWTRYGSSWIKEMIKPDV